jgi:hypothetical protein
MTVIYRDDKRTLEMDDHGRFIAKNAKGQSLYCDLAAETTVLSDRLPAGTEKVLRDRGDNPNGWYALMEGKHARAVLPPQSRQAMQLAIATAQAERRQVINDPAHVARRRISALFAKAHQLQDDPGRYFPVLIEAQAALKQWQEQYPGAANKERRHALLTDADELDQKASGALVYDADGSLSSDEQQRRHDAFKAQATAKRAEANQIGA